MPSNVLLDRFTSDGPHRIDAASAELRCELRRAHPYWRARKVLAVLARRHPTIAQWPAARTAVDLLERPALLPAMTRAPNDRWTADFTRQFRTSNGVYGDPLPIADQHTRYPLMCHGLLSTHTVTARPIFERSFREYGVPLDSRTDHGVPFATQAMQGRSDLTVWWMRRGLPHHRIHPGQPQEHGAHERRHRTLNRQSLPPVQLAGAKQQRNFDAFQHGYNTERPHEHMQQQPPASHDTTATRPYPSHFVIKNITTGGTFRFGTRVLDLATAMTEQTIGLEAVDDGPCIIDVNAVSLATFNEYEYIMTG